MGGALGAIGAALVGTLAKAERVLAAGSDDQVALYTGGQYNDVTYTTLLQNQQTSATLLSLRSTLSGTGVLGGTAGGIGVQGTATTGVGAEGSSASGTGVQGTSGAGDGVHGDSTSGYGGLFSGGRSQLRLVPKATAGKPTSGTHVKGEIYLDSKGAVFICVAGGTPGTWRKVRTAAT